MHASKRRRGVARQSRRIERHKRKASYQYSKAEVMRLNLCQPGEFTEDLFVRSQLWEATKVMSVLDSINGR